ncbi:MAG: IS1 family transposase [Thermoflexales bacterium]|nr:IS1 family transposase [Thermoflexales bacterium]
MAAPIPQPPPDDDTVVELDERFTFVGRKNGVYLITQVERRRALRDELVDTLSRDEAVSQAVVDQATRALQDCTDGFNGYAALDYHGGWHRVAPGKSQTYSVEAGHAELRQALTRLGRRTRCFSRCVEALRRSVALFVQCWNRRQLFKQAHPGYQSYPRDYASIWV